MCLRATYSHHARVFIPLVVALTFRLPCIAGHRAALPCFWPCPLVDCTCTGLIGVAPRLPPYGTQSGKCCFGTEGCLVRCPLGV